MPQGFEINMRLLGLDMRGKGIKLGPRGEGTIHTRVRLPGTTCFYINADHYVVDKMPLLINMSCKGLFAKY